MLVHTKLAEKVKSFLVHDPCSNTIKLLVDSRFYSPSFGRYGPDPELAGDFKPLGWSLIKIFRDLVSL